MSILKRFNKKVGSRTRGLSCREIAGRVGMPLATVKWIMAGKAKLRPIITLEKFCKGLGFSLKDIL